jgi:dTDP-glucose pyrophosphorylase
MYKMQESDCDGGIVVFKSKEPKWSFAKIDDKGFVTEVAEKNPISENATVGFYYWKKGSDFVKYAESMINKNLRVNNEFYICPVYNQAITDGKKVIIYEINKMWGLGTPEDLNNFLKKNESRG